MWFTIYLGILGVLLLIFLWKRKQYKYNYPPGLPVWPIVGSMPYFKGAHLHFNIQEWAKKYGPIISGSMGNKNALFVTGADNVIAALRKEEFQGRPDEKSIRARSFDKRLGVFFSDGNQWTEARRFTMRQLRAFGSAKTEEFMKREINLLNERIKDGVVMEINGIFALPAVNVIWFIIANRTFEPEDERIRLFVSDNKTFFRAGNPSGSIADIYPILGYFDKNYQYRLSHIRDTQRLIKGLIDEHKQILDPNHPFDLIDNYLVEMDKQKNKPGSTFTEEDLITICFDLFSAGAEPMSGSLDFVMLYLVLYPEVQKKMQEEIDSVLQKARKPMLEDKNRLHYTMAVLNEVSRINTTAPVAVPHRCTKSTHFNDYYVEKDTTIFLDLWSLGYDTKYWEKPDEFRPERFLDSDGKLMKNNILHPFGLGQRVCAGEYLTKSLTFLFITTFFEKYSLSLPEGEPKPSTLALPGFTTGVQAFKAKIQSRY